MATNISSTELDFETIKSSLKTYFAQQAEFADYNFETSGLSNVLDVLAYNTHYNGLIANMATNEAFLNTAQLRSSVVSHAEALGYRPRSKTASSTSLNLTLDLTNVSGRPSTITLPARYTFNASNDSLAYVFTTNATYTAADDSGVYNFKDASGSTSVVLHEGIYKTKTFIVNDAVENQVFVIPDRSVDTSNITVKVFASPTSAKFNSFFFLDTALTVDATTRFFDVKEAPNGYFEINFGDGKSFGVSPKLGEKIVVEYFSTSGAEANGSTGFTPVNSIKVNSINYTPSVLTQVASANGGDLETIESIRKLAPLQFAAQKRLVTPLDYKAMILSNFPEVKDVNVWGGEDNVPIDYGKVYISLQYNDGTTDAVKAATLLNIKTNYTDKLSVVSIRNEFVDPKESYLEFTGNFHYNPSLTTSSGPILRSLVESHFATYFATNLNQFEKSFMRSNLLTEIDALDKSITSSSINVKIQQRLVPTTSSAMSYAIYYPIVLAAPDKDVHVIRSSLFGYGNDGTNARVQNKLGSSQLQIVSINNKILKDYAGDYDYKSGTVTLSDFSYTTIVAGQNYIEFSATPQEPSKISPLRNYVLRLDPSKLSMQPIQDYQETKVAI